MRFIISAAGAVLAVFVVIMTLQARTDIISVSNTVNGRNLPIYSVDTEEKKIAISFDAAWGGSKLR